MIQKIEKRVSETKIWCNLKKHQLNYMKPKSNTFEFQFLIISTLIFMQTSSKNKFYDFGNRFQI